TTVESKDPLSSGGSQGGRKDATTERRKVGKDRSAPRSSVSPQPAQHLPVVGEFVFALRGLEDLGDRPEPRVAHDPPEWAGPQAPLGDELVAVAAGIERGLRIVQVQAAKVPEADDRLPPIPHPIV